MIYKQLYGFKYSYVSKLADGSQGRPEGSFLNRGVGAIPFFESLVWLDLGLIPGLPGHFYMILVVYSKLLDIYKLLLIR